MGNVYPQITIQGQLKSFPPGNIFCQSMATEAAAMPSHGMEFTLGPLLAKLGIKQAQLAEMTDLSPGYISLLVSGSKKPSPKTLQKIASKLNVGIPELFGATPKGDSQEPEEPGFAEPAVEFMDTPPAQKPKSSDEYQYLIARMPELSLGIVAGDILYMDLASPRTRGIAAVTKADNRTGAVTTLIRQVEGDTILSPHPGAPPEQIESEQYSFGILGWIVQIQRDL